MQEIHIQLPFELILFTCSSVFSLPFRSPDGLTYSCEWHDGSFRGQGFCKRGSCCSPVKCQLSQRVHHCRVLLRQPFCSRSHLAEPYCWINKAVCWVVLQISEGNQALTLKIRAGRIRRAEQESSTLQEMCISCHHNQCRNVPTAYFLTADIMTCNSVKAQGKWITLTTAVCRGGDALPASWYLSAPSLKPLAPFDIVLFCKAARLQLGKRLPSVQIAF